MTKIIPRSLKDKIRLVGIKSNALLSRYFSKPKHFELPSLLFIAGLPKSGTTWLAQLLEQVPGYKSAFVYDPDDCSLNHDVCRDIFAHLPSNMHYVMKLHTRYTFENMKTLDEFNIKPVIMYRDLRDQCVSRYFHVLNDRTHRHFKLYNSLPKDEAMMHNISLTIDDYLPWIEDWQLIIQQQLDRFHVVTYEKLRENPVKTFSGVLNFFQIVLSQDEIEDIVEKVASKTKFDIKENLSKHKGTARKGIVGDWRNHFSKEHVQYFKEKCGQHLIDIGYEKDLNWSLEQ